ncbi:MAG: Hsp70 family protein [Scytonema sp. PMC 1069.18]|nr:Hsp70 family protein [Scytonema sp. PMC 1069.18]MEC4880189.1 Hsp70 family protein [Scytonema sp. PMC 1070.18]
MSVLKIGLDFGTTNSIISFLNPYGGLEVFKYDPLGNKDEYIPSFVAYTDDLIEIGTAARNVALHDPKAECYSNFKMRLPLPESEFSNYFRGDRTPMSVTADYLRELLIASNNEYSFSCEKGKIDGLVVSVPEIWQRDICNLGRERLQKLIVEELKLPLMQLVSEPVAAAAYYAWEINQKAKQERDNPFTGNLLVCDMGGGTFDVSLCRIYGDNKVEVLYFDGQGDKGLESAGVAFDRYCVNMAYTKRHGKSLDEKTPEFTRLLREFETIKISSHKKIRNKLNNYVKLPEDFADETVINFGMFSTESGYSVTCSDMDKAFAPIKQGIQRVIQRVQEYLQRENQQLNRVFLVGGFSQFLLVQKAITDVLGIEDNDSRLDKSFNITNRAYAISYGACLIANQLIDPTEKYIHTLGIVVDTINTRTLDKEKKFVSIIEGGINQIELAQPRFANIQPLVTFQNDGDVTVTLWIDPMTRGKKIEHRLPKKIKLHGYSPNDQWRVGMRVDSSQVAYLVMEEIREKKRLEYPLGNIIADIFPGLVLIEE